MRDLEFIRARNILQDFIDFKIQDIRYEVVENAPEKYKDMVDLYNESGYFHIKGDASDLTIYSNPNYNVKFRAIHDKMHYDYKLNFNFDSEKILSKITECLLFVWAADKYPTKDIENACKIVDAEIKGQIEYYQKNGDFVKNQKQFVRNYLTPNVN